MLGDVSCPRYCSTYQICTAIDNSWYQWFQSYQKQKWFFFLAIRIHYCTRLVLVCLVSLSPCVGTIKFIYLKTLYWNTVLRCTIPAGYKGEVKNSKCYNLFISHLPLLGRIPPSTVSLTLRKTEEKVDDGDCRYLRVQAHVFFIRTEFIRMWSSDLAKTYEHFKNILSLKF